MIRRRTFLASFAVGLLLPWRTGKAQPARVFRIGWLMPGPKNRYEDTFIGSLPKFGYTEGQNLIVERRSGAPGDLPSMALDLVRMKVDLIWAGGSSAVRAATGATREVPIVAVDLESDPIASGYASTLAHPGGNLTGFFLDLPEFSAKRLEVLKEALPTVSRVMVLWDSSLDRAPLSRMDAAARVLKLRLIFAEMREAADLANVFEAAVKRKAQAVLLMQSPTLDSHKDKILNLGAKYRLPVFAVFAFFTADGALLSYGPNIDDMVVRSAAYIDKVFRGMKPGDLPIQRPTKFDMVVNSTTAKSLGLTIAQSILLRADEVIR